MQRPSYTLALVAILTAVAAVSLAQADSSGAMPRNYGGFAVGGQAFAVNSLNRALALQRYPEFESAGVDLSVLRWSRGKGRLASQARLGLTFFARPNSTRFTTNAGGSVETTYRNVDLGAIAVGLGYYVDLLYPSAWDLYVGAEFGMLAGRLTTSSFQTTARDEPDFDNPTSEVRHLWGSAYITPELKLHSVEFSLGGVPSRITATVGYRLASDGDLTRKGFDDLETNLAIDPDGLRGTLGLISLVPTKRRR